MDRNLKSFVKKALLLVLIVPIFLMSCYVRVPGRENRRGDCLNAGCHDDYLKKEHVHEPVKDGKCMSCHIALSDSHPNEDMPDFEVGGAKLCFSCHADIKKISDTARVLHEPFKEKVCILCHRPHSSDNPKLTKIPLPELCYSCHEDFFNYRIKNRRYLHTPVKEGKCTACHNQHGSNNRVMLKARVPAKYYLPFKIEHYSLCWKCHKKEMVLEPLTEEYTDFRNGNVNLHYKHVNKDTKGKPCKTCHDPHAGDQPMNIWQYTCFELTDGRTHIPVNYQKTDTGGWCETGCHKEKKYDRVNPVVYN